MSHEHDFKYSSEASEAGRFVTICAGCGDVKVTQLKRAPELVPTEIPGVWDVLTPRRDRRRDLMNEPGVFRKLID